MKPQKTPDAYFDKPSPFQSQLKELRELAIAAGMKETLKWGMPVYTIDGKNVAGISAFKTHYGIWFFQGALLKDPEKVLKNAQEGKTKAMRQWRFTAGDELDHKKIFAYLNEAVGNQKKGLVIKPEKIKKELLIPEELTMAFRNDKQLESYFNQFSQSKKREFADYISEAKREETRHKRLEKIIPMIKNQVSLNEKYMKSS